MRKPREAKLHEPRDITKGLLPVRGGAAPVAFAATGSVSKAALEAALILSERGLKEAVNSCPILSADFPEVFRRLWQYQTLLTVEEHVRFLGLGSFLKELSSRHVHIHSCAIPEANASLVGSQDFLRKQAGLDAESLAQVAIKLAGA